MSTMKFLAFAEVGIDAAVATGYDPLRNPSLEPGAASRAGV